jgi:hypothetical protein
VIQSKRSGAGEDEVYTPTKVLQKAVITDRPGDKRKSKTNLDDGTENEVSHHYYNTVTEWPFSLMNNNVCLHYRYNN